MPAPAAANPNEVFDNIFTIQTCYKTEIVLIKIVE